MPIKEADNISINGLLAIIWRRKFAIVLPALLLTLAAGAYAYYLPERFQARALVENEGQINFPNAQTPTVEEQLWNVREILLARPTLETINAEFTLYPSNEDPVEKIKSRIHIDVVNAKAFHVGFQGESPELVSRVANRLAEMFVIQTTGAQTRSVDQANGLIQEERASLQSKLELLRGKLARQSADIQGYKERVGAALPERFAADVRAMETLDNRIQAVNSAVVNDQAARAAAVKEMADLEKRGALEPSLPLPVDPSAAQRRLDEVRLELAKARTRYTERNTEVTNLVKLVKELEQALPQAERGRTEPSSISLRYLQLNAGLEGIDQRLESQRQELASLTSRLRTAGAADRDQVASVPQRENDMALLMRDYATTQESYQELLAKQNVSGLIDAPDKFPDKFIRATLFTIAEPARPPLTPYSPQRERIILMGLFAGLCLGGMIAFGAEQLNTSFLNAEEFAAFTTMPVLAEVASISRKNGGHTNVGRIVTVKQPTSVAAEQYFTLAEKIRQRCQSKAPVVLAITSAAGGEGKTLTSLNLSIALAKGSKGKVLLVDADLRRPMLHKYLELGKTKRKGFGDLLEAPGDDIHEYILQYNGVSVIPSYKGVANPLGMLTADRVRVLLERMSREFAFVVVDSPPIVPIADGHVLANLADHVLLIVRARRTPRELFKLAVESLNCSNVIGVAVNNVNLEHSRYSSAYRYYQKNYQTR